MVSVVSVGQHPYIILSGTNFRSSRIVYKFVFGSIHHII